MTRDRHDSTQCSISGGRWDNGTFDVLYTSAERAGAINEMKFHIMRGQPVIPSLVSYNLYSLEVSLDRALKLLDMNALKKIGFDTSRFGQISYAGYGLKRSIEKYLRLVQIEPLRRNGRGKVFWTNI